MKKRRTEFLAIPVTLVLLGIFVGGEGGSPGVPGSKLP
jgi:hypothetical protein